MIYKVINPTLRKLRFCELALKFGLEVLNCQYFVTALWSRFVVCFFFF